MAKIIYINPATNVVSVMEETAITNVPRGCKFKIVEDSDIPSDYSFRDAWVVDEAELTEGVGKNDNYS